MVTGVSCGRRCFVGTLMVPGRFSFSKAGGQTHSHQHQRVDIPVGRGPQKTRVLSAREFFCARWRQDAQFSGSTRK